MWVRILYKTLLKYPSVVNLAQNLDYFKSIEKSILNQYLNGETGEWALDVACGLGIFTKVLRSKFPKVVGIDVSAERVSQAHRVSPECDYVVADAHHLPFRHCSFDTVISICSLEHFENSLSALIEINNILRDSGVLIVTVDSWEHNKLRIPRFLLKPEVRTILNNNEDLELETALKRYHELEYSVKRRYRKDQLIDELSRIGFTTIDYDYLISGFAVPLELALRGLARLGVISFLLFPLWLVLVRSRINKRSGYVLATKATKRSVVCMN